MCKTGHNLQSETGRIWHFEHRNVCCKTMVLCAKGSINMNAEQTTALNPNSTLKAIKLQSCS
jgi:hypothetical protein